MKTCNCKDENIQNSVTRLPAIKPDELAFFDRSLSQQEKAFVKANVGKAFCFECGGEVGPGRVSAENLDPGPVSATTMLLRLRVLGVIDVPLTAEERAFEDDYKAREARRAAGTLTDEDREHDRGVKLIALLDRIGALQGVLDQVTASKYRTDSVN